jgi:putative ABC transport system ATP-binding protein
VLLADEPTGSLDAKSVSDTVALLNRTRAASGTTLLLVTHDPTVAAAADRVVHLRDGGVVHPGASSALS